MKYAAITLYEQALKAYNCLFSVFSRISLDIKTKLSLFDAMIAPILLYGSEVWGIDLAKTRKDGTNIDMYLEKHLQNNFLTKLETKFYRQLLKVRRNAPIHALRGELGRHPISIRAINTLIKYCNQI